MGTPLASWSKHASQDCKKGDAKCRSLAGGANLGRLHWCGVCHNWRAKKADKHCKWG